MEKLDRIKKALDTIIGSDEVVSSNIRNVFTGYDRRRLEHIFLIEYRLSKKKSPEEQFPLMKDIADREKHKSDQQKFDPHTPTQDKQK